MFMTIEVHHAIRNGMEREALQVLRDLNNTGLDYPGDSSSNKELLLRGGAPGLEVTNGYRDHLGKIFS